MSARQLARWLGALTVAAGVLTLAAPDVRAASGALVHQAWAQTGPAPVAGPQPERIYVAATAGGESSRAFVEMTRGASLGALVLVEGGDSVLSDQAGIAACALASPVPGDGQITEPPAVDCRDRADATLTAPGQWRLELGVFAARWVAGGPVGVALLPSIGATTDTWRVSLDVTRTSVVTAPVPPSSGGGVGATPHAPSVHAAGPSGAGVSPDQALLPPATPTGAASPPVVAQPGQVPVAAPFQTRGATAGSPSAAHPGVLPALMIVGIAGLTGALAVRRRARAAAGVSQAVTDPRRSGAGAFAAVAVLLGFLGVFLNDVNVYKVGLVLIVFVGAIGLHVLVNWAGELSLAHAAFVGVPAFVVAKLAGEHGVSPVYLLPIGVLVGAALGAVVGLPALRAKGLQVTLLTLAFYIAVNRFLFTRSWFIGPSGGYAIPTPQLGPIELRTVRSLYVVLLIAVLLAGLAAWMLWWSRVARGLRWVRDTPTAAAAFGVPVASYRVIAYGIAGAFGGFAGALTVMWVQRVTPDAFSLQLSYTYLIIAVLAGRGFVWGVGAAAVTLEGGRLFLPGGSALIAYGGPLNLILMLTRYKTGLNGIGRQLMQKIQSSLPATTAETALSRARCEVWAGVVAIAGGFTAIGFAWYHAGNTSQVWIQNQEMISGGIGGLAAVLVGVGLLIRDQIATGQRELASTLAAFGRDLQLDQPGPLDADVAALLAENTEAADIVKGSHRRIRTRA